MEYEPIFKVAYFNIFLTDLYLAPYIDSNPIATIKNGKWELFLSKDTLDKYSKEGFEFALDENKYKKFEIKYSFFEEKFQKLKEINLGKLNREEFLKFLDEFRDLIIDFFKIYKETEFFYFTKIEKQLNEYIQDKFSFQDLLSNKVNIASWPEAMRKLADYIINMQHLKFEYRKLLNDIGMGESSLGVKLLEQLVIKTNREDAPSMTIKELKKMLNGKKVKDVSDRHVYSYITWDKEKQELNIISGGEAYRKIRELDKYVPKNEVIGTPACKGIIKGKARVITMTLSTDAVEYLLKVNKGDILVAGTTGPEMIPAIERAGGIVTDEGGMMSHAAIVSREFNIPCVVGTKYATKTFKDGDLIEVNANNGVVRKI